MIIAIEGIDGSGKNTQASLLARNLSERGYNVVLMGFPCYSETFFGKEVGHYLNGNFGGLNEVDPKLASILYAGDRYEKKSDILQALRNGSVVIIDRYVSSNVAHQSAKVSDETQEELQRWIEKLEYDVFGLPRATINILLNLDASHSAELVQKKNTRDYTTKSHDLHEEDSSYLEKVAKVYYSLARNSNNWTLVDCLDNNILRTIDDISEDVLAAALKAM
ncbi:dTMP kinase [Vibrio parahaemolyticus]|jgi:dTMP kinase|uniref:dTMP kinase n=1 Tax=Vibrio TaxID=662 RepID=UPI001A26E347|nr:MULTISPECIES: dTMP kinase [Vibrio]EGQ7918622.1 dTMP kinase [Vibrio parahaemolyticus]EGR0771082.1 dTMP kinase [Vibrio parahaemolyticus]EGR0840732.1 dTMP kinase [Vibrio parahaemolyticus]EJL7426823.1 dTMP kinase [Vibrio parahaemolyticus]EJS0325240.1 dTMP kinase [Vibrio alginolyticus]